MALDGVLDRPHENRRQAAQRAVSTLFEEVRDPLARYLIHIGVPKDQVEEPVQAAFLKLFEHLLAGGDETNLRGWVFRVARNAAVNEMRRHRRFVSAEAGEAESRDSVDRLRADEYAEALRDPQRLPDQIVLDQERQRQLKTALSRLSPVQRECLHLRAAGMRYREIAEVVRIPVSTVADYLHRALEQLGEECDG